MTPPGSHDRLEEKLADLEHASWSRWMVYLFNTCGLNEDGTVTIPKVLVDRWEKQTLTDYKDLPDEMKQLDRDEIQPVLTLIAAEVVAKEIADIEKAYGGCRKCYGKGWASYREVLHGAADFYGDKEFTSDKIVMRFCTCERGKQLKKMVADLLSAATHTKEAEDE